MWQVFGRYLPNQFFYIKTKKMKKLLMCLLFAGSLTAVATAQNVKAPKSHTLQQSKDYIILKDGKINLVKGSNITPIESDMTLTNGTVISTNGSVKSSEGTTVLLKEGEKIDLDGKMIMKTDESKKDSI